MRPSGDETKTRTRPLITSSTWGPGSPSRRTIDPAGTRRRIASSMSGARSGSGTCARCDKPMAARTTGSRRSAPMPAYPNSPPCAVGASLTPGAVPGVSDVTGLAGPMAAGRRTGSSPRWRGARPGRPRGEAHPGQGPGHLVRRRPGEVRRSHDDQVPVDIHDPELGGTQEAVLIDHRVGIDEGPGFGLPHEGLTIRALLERFRRGDLNQEPIGAVDRDRHGDRSLEPRPRRHRCRELRRRIDTVRFEHRGTRIGTGFARPLRRS